jgi:hypothetical protein
VADPDKTSGQSERHQLSSLLPEVGLTAKPPNDRCIKYRCQEVFSVEQRIELPPDSVPVVGKSKREGLPNHPARFERRESSRHYGYE